MPQSLILIKQQNPHTVKEAASAFKYLFNSETESTTNWAEFNDRLYMECDSYTGKYIAFRGVYQENGFTIINDPDIADSTDDEALVELSNKLETTVYSFGLRSSTRTYMFNKYKNGVIERAFFSSNGKVINDFGKKIKEEKGLDYSGNIKEEYFLDLAKNIGVDFTKPAASQFLFYKWKYSEELITEVKKIDNLS